MEVAGVVNVFCDGGLGDEPIGQHVAIKDRSALLGRRQTATVSAAAPEVPSPREARPLAPPAVQDDWRARVKLLTVRLAKDGERAGKQVLSAVGAVRPSAQRRAPLGAPGRLQQPIELARLRHVLRRHL